MPSISRKSRWKFSLSRWITSGTDSASVGAGGGGGGGGGVTRPPMSFICPISSCLMHDPVIVPSGQTFERACIEACRELNFIPPSPLSSSSSASNPLSNPNPDSTDSPPFFLFLIPNAALRAAIIDWCDRLSLPHPSPISRESARALVQNLILTRPNPSPTPNSIPIGSISQKEEAAADEERVLDYYSTAKTLNDKQQPESHPQPPPCSSSSSYSSSSSSSEINSTNPSTPPSSSDDPTTPKKSTPVTVVEDPDPLEESILTKLKSPQTSVNESGLIALRHSARDGGPSSRMSLCTPRILAALIPFIVPNSTGACAERLQVNAAAAIVNLSIDPPANKVKIVRSGAVPALVDALKLRSSGSEEARYNAAGALLSLALEDENKLVIGVLGAIPPLVHLFCQESAGSVARGEAGMALYHLSLASNNMAKIAKTPGAVKAMLHIAATKDSVDEEMMLGCEGLRLRLQRVAMMVLASLARRKEGRVALMDADAVKAMVGLMEEESSGSGTREEEYCLGVLYEMSKGSLRFRASAKAAGAERVLSQLVAASSSAHAERGELAREMARRIFKGIKGDHGDRRRPLMNAEAEDEDEEIGSVVSDGLVSFRRRRFDDFGAAGGSASNSANF